MKIGSNESLVMIGDSITDCGRARPVGRKAGLGNGYPKLVWALLNSVYPERKIKVENTGISGQRVTDLAARWDTDVLELDPDWVSILIGINDVWRHFDQEGYVEQVDLECYETTLQEAVTKTLPSVKGMVVMAPYLLEPNPSDPMRAMMDEYGAAARSVAEESGAMFVDLQAEFDRFLEGQPSQFLCGDRIHVNVVGHMVIARALLNAFDFAWSK